MDLFLRFLILGGKYLSQLTAQSIVEAYRRSVQLGRTLNAQNTIAVVSHYDSVLEMYQRNLQEFQTLPHAHLAFISEQHKQEFETYLHGSSRVSEEELMSLCAHDYTTNGDVAAEGQSFAQQVALSFLGSYGRGNRNRSKFNAITCPPQENLEATVSDVQEDPPEVDYTTRDNVKSFAEYTKSTANVINMFKENRQDGVLTSVAEYLDKQAEYIKCANDTFKQLQVDIRNKYAQMQKEPFELNEQDEDEVVFAMKLKAVQKEVENCTNLMKKAQDHFDVVDEDAKTKRLFQSIDKIIGDVEEITKLIQINNEHFATCEKLIEETKEKANGVFVDYNEAEKDRVLVKAISRHILQHTPCTQNISRRSESQMTPIGNNILSFIDRFTDQNTAKLMEANQKAFEKTEKSLRYPLIGRWYNIKKKSRKLARAKERKKKSKLPSKKFSKCSKVANARSRLLGPPLQRVSADNLPMKNFIALSSTWIKDRQHSALIGNQLMGMPSEQPERTVVNINQAIGKYLPRQRSQEVVESNTITIDDENLDNLVEKLLTSIKNETTYPENDCVPQDEYKLNAFCEIKKDIDTNLRMVREQQFSVPPAEPITCALTSMNNYATISAVDRDRRDISNEAEVEPIMFDALLVDALPTDFEPAVEASPTIVEKASNISLAHVGESGIRQLAAARRQTSESADWLGNRKEDRCIEQSNVKCPRDVLEILGGSDEIQIKSTNQELQKNSQQDINKDNSVVIELTQGKSEAPVANKDAMAFPPIEIEAFAATPIESDGARFKPMEINIDYPEVDPTASKVSLLISISPLIQRIENLETIVREQQKPSPSTIDYVPKQKLSDADVINASALMKDIVSEMEKKSEILEWQNNNMLFQLANEMNQNAAIKTREKNARRAAAQQLQRLFDMDDAAIENSPNAGQMETPIKCGYKDNSFDILSPGEQNTIDTLKVVQSLVDQDRDNLPLATNVTSPKSAYSFRKYRAEAAIRWNPFKSSTKSKRSKKSYTVIKTKNSEITLTDMIYGGSRILNPTKEIYGTRKISFNNKKTELKRLKPSPAQTMIRKESRDIKLIPMNLLKPIDRTPEEVAEITKDDEVLKLNQYRTEVAKSYGKASSVISTPSIAESTGSMVQNIAAKDTSKKITQRLGNFPKLEKIMETSSEVVISKEQPFADISNKNQLCLTNRKLDDFSRRSRQPRSTNTSCKASTKLKNIRENYQKLKKRPNFAMHASSPRSKCASVTPTEEISVSSSNRTAKTSHNASVDANPVVATKPQVVQEIPLELPKPKVDNWKKVKVPAVMIPEVKPEVSLMELAKLQMSADQKSTQFSSKNIAFFPAYNTDECALREKALKKTPSEESTLSKRSNSKESLKSKDAKEVEFAGVEDRHLYQVSPNTIIEEVHPISSCQERRKSRVLEERSLNVGDFAEDVNTCDYDIKYKYDVPNIPAARPTGLDLDPIIKENVENSHYAENEEYRKGQTSKILIDYDGLKSTNVDDQSTGKISKSAASQQDADKDKGEIMVNNDNYKGKQHCFQARYQSSTTEANSPPPQNVKPTLSQLPKLDHIAEQILAEQEAIDVKNILQNCEIPAPSKTPSSPRLSKGKMSPRGTKHVKLNETDFVAPQGKSSKPTEDDRYMASPNLKTLQTRTEEAVAKDEKADESVDASTSCTIVPTLQSEITGTARCSTCRVKTYNISNVESPTASQPILPPKYVSDCPVPRVKMQSLNVSKSSFAPMELETKSISGVKLASIPMPHKAYPHRKSAKITFPVSQTHKKAFAKDTKLRQSWESPLSDAIRQSRVRFHPDTDALSFKKLNRLSIKKMGKPPQIGKLENVKTDKMGEPVSVIPNLLKPALKSAKSIVSYKSPRMATNSDLVEVAEAPQDARATNHKKVIDQIKSVAIEEKKIDKDRHTVTLDSYEKSQNKSAVKNSALSLQAAPLSFQPKYESASKVVPDSKNPRTKGNSVKLCDEISRTSIPNTAMKSLAKIEPSMNKPFVDMSSVASDMIKSGANHTYISQLNSQIKDPAYTRMLEKCYPNEKEQCIDVQAAKVIPAIKPDPIKPTTESKSAEENPIEVAPPPKPLVRIIQNEPKTQVHTKPKYIFKKSKSQTILRTKKRIVYPNPRLPAVSRVFEPEPVDETFFTKPPPKPFRKKQRAFPRDDLLNNKEHFVAVDELDETEKPMPRTYGKMILGNLDKHNNTSEPVRNRANPPITTNVSLAMPKEGKVKKPETFLPENKAPEIETPKHLMAKHNNDMPEFMRFKSNERERNLKRLIAMDEKIKKLETKRGGNKVDKGTYDKTIVGGVKASKAQEAPPLGRRATNLKETSSMGGQNSKSFSNNSTKSQRKRKAKSVPLSDEEETDAASIKEAEVPTRVYARGGHVSAVSFKKSVAQERESEPEEKTCSRRVYPTNRSMDTPRWQSRDGKPQKRISRIASVINRPSTPSTSVKVQMPKEYQEPTSFEKWKLPTVRRKNALPHVPELEDVEVVVPKKASSTLEMIPKTMLATPQNKQSLDPLQIVPPPFRPAIKSQPMNNYYVDESRYFESIEDAPDMTARSMHAESESRTNKPYKLKNKKAVVEDTASKHSQFDERKTKSLKFFQKKVKQTIQDMEQKEKKKVDKEKTYVFAKKSIAPYTNTIGRHLFRMRTDADETKQKNAQDYHKALAEKLQNMSSLARIEDDTIEPSKFVYKPPLVTGGIRDTKKPSLSDVKKSIIKHLKDTTPVEKRINELSTALV